MESTRNRLILLLSESNDQYISGQVLSDALGISRTAIWKHMKELEKDGYKIEGKSSKGYRITAIPEKLSKNTLKWGLKTEWLGKKIVHKSTTTSTQHIAHQLAQENAAHGTVVIADEQTMGKGRMNRPWFSEKEKGIWMSLILRPQILPQSAPQLTLMTATVLADVFATYNGVVPQIKWPNDLLIKSKKTAGILTEMQAEQDQIQYIVIGIGVNVNHTKKELPDDLPYKATSLHMATEEIWDIKKLIQHILYTFEKTYDTYMKDGFAPIKQKWEKYGFRLGEEISINTMKDSWNATFLGIANDGALLTKMIDGEVKKLYSAEIDWYKNEKGE